MKEILTQAELHDLTGYRMPSKVISWLAENGVPYLLTGQGKPLVHRAALAQRMGAANEQDSSGIDLDAIA